MDAGRRCRSWSGGRGVCRLESRGGAFLDGGLNHATSAGPMPTRRRIATWRRRVA